MLQKYAFFSDVKKKDEKKESFFSSIEKKALFLHRQKNDSVVE